MNYDYTTGRPTTALNYAAKLINSFLKDNISEPCNASILSCLLYISNLSLIQRRKESP